MLVVSTIMTTQSIFPLAPQCAGVAMAEGGSRLAEVSSPPVAEHIAEATGHTESEAGFRLQRSDGERGEPAAASALFFAYPIELTFYTLRANSEARVQLDASMQARWGNGEPDSKLVGISLCALPRGTTLTLSSFIVNFREIHLVTYQACQEIRVRLYVHTLERSFSGRVDVPPSATVTIESPLDRTTLAENGLSSFVLALR